jgi:DNA-binding NarL/FixJ family response regulator
MKILIVEDEFLLALNYQESLKKINGYEFVGVTGIGQDAVDLAFSEDPEVILMDIKLKGDMDGITAAQEIQKKKNIPIIFLTGNSDESTKERAMKTHPAAYLEKPVDISYLNEIIHNAI